MYRLFIKQKVFSWKDKFNVFDEYGNSIFYVEGEFFSLGKKLHIQNMNGEEIAFIHQKLLSFLPRFYISRYGADIAEVVKKITFFKDRYVVDEFGWEIKGDFLAHEYEFFFGGRSIARVHKQWLAWGDTYAIEISDGADPVNVLCVVLIIDAVKAAEAEAAQASN